MKYIQSYTRNFLKRHFIKNLSQKYPQQIYPTNKQTMSAVRLHPMFPVRGTPQEQEAFSLKLKERMSIIHARNQEAKRIKSQQGTKRLFGVLNENVPVKVHAVCQAVNLNNTQCKFRATCGRFCKKHQISAKDLCLFDE
jgi:hypothetical protein